MLLQTQTIIMAPSRWEQVKSQHRLNISIGSRLK
jgi:hypothetical protein